jgi:hypothetical protein
MQKILSLVVMFVSFAASGVVRADDQQQVLPVFCGTDQTTALAAYQEKIDDVEKFANWSKAAKLAVIIAVIIPAAPLAIVVGVSVAGGGGAVGDLGTAGLVLVGGAAVAGADYGVIKGVKHIETRHDREVRDNLLEADGLKPKDNEKRLKHTAKLINKKTPGAPYTVAEIAQALREADVAGDLCKDGKLVETGEFRDAIVKHLERRPE